jgi:hypothetical protein
MIFKINFTSREKGCDTDGSFYYRIYEAFMQLYSFITTLAEEHFRPVSFEAD